MKFLITAGPTYEAIDPVRFIGNRSSGKMGYSLAKAVAEKDHECILISGPTKLEAPTGVELILVESAEEMYGKVVDNIEGVDVGIFCAAVSDFTPVKISKQKVKKKGKGTWSIELKKTEDILGSVRGEMNFKGVLVGFAAETENLESNAKNKLETKKCDLIVANDVSNKEIGFNSENNIVTIFSTREDPLALPLMTKIDLSVVIVEHCLRLAKILINDE